METIFRPKKALVFQPSKVLIVGNGAVISGWEPMINAVKKSELFKHLAKTENEEIAKYIELIPSQIIHEYNLIRSVIISKLSSGLSTKYLEIIKSFLRCFFEFLENIANEYNKSFSFRQEIDLVISMIDNKTGTITLNYDNSVWDHKQNDVYTFENLIHLHGRAVDPESLYFPTDNLILDEIPNLLKLFPDQNKQKALFQEIDSILIQKIGKEKELLQRRHPTLRENMNAIHETCIDWMSEAEEIIIWGIGLNSYDSELLTILNRTTGGVNKERKLTVINTNKNTGDKAQAYLHIKPNNYAFIEAKKS